MNPRINFIKRMFFLAILGGIILPSMMFFAGNYSRFFIDVDAIHQSDDFKLAYTGESFIDSISLVQQELREGECILVLRQAEFAYYQDGCIVNYLDPRLVDFYNSNNVELAAKELKELNIRFVVVPNGYGMSEVYNSELEGLLANNNFSRLIQQTAVFDLYQLSTPNKPLPPLTDVVGDRDFGTFKSQDLFNSVVFFSGKGDYMAPDRAYVKSSLNSNELIYKLKLSFKGEGFYRVYITDYTPPTGMYRVAYDNDILLRWGTTEKLIWEGLVDGERSINRQLIRNLNDNSGFRLSIRPVGAALEPEGITAFAEYSIFEPTYYSRRAYQQAGYQNGWNSYSNASRRGSSWVWGSDKNNSAFMFVEKKNNYFLSKVIPVDDFTQSIKVSYDFITDGQHYVVAQSVNNRFSVKPIEVTLREWLFNLFNRPPQGDNQELTESVHNVFGDIVASHSVIRGVDRYNILDTDVLSETPRPTEFSNTNLSNEVCLDVKEDSDFVQFIIMLLGDNSQTIDSDSFFNISLNTVESFDAEGCRNKTNIRTVN